MRSRLLRVSTWVRGLAAAAWVCAAPAPLPAQTTFDTGAGNAWATGGVPASATIGKDGSPAAAPPVWQTPALPTAVIQGGAIPPGWQPQAVPYQGTGPDGRPVTMYFAPTYVFTYQSGPPVIGTPPVNRRQAWGAAPATTPGWNFATTGAQPVAATVPTATVTRYRSTPYQFPADSRALSAGTPIVPPAGMPPAPPQAYGAAPAGQLAPPPSQWGPSNAPPPPGFAPPAGPQPPAPGVPPGVPAQQPATFAAAPAPPAAQPSGTWAAVVPPAVASAAIAANAATASAVPPVPTGPIPSSAAPLAAVAPASPAAIPPAQPIGATLPPQPASGGASTHVWRVVGVQDGDTLTCLDETNQQQKVRLAEIDAPEVGQEHGRASREALATMTFGKVAQVVDQGRDQYGRWVAHVSVDGVDVNRQMVATGNAWQFTDFSRDQSLADLQSQAQAQRLGLWSQPNPIPPWQFRQNGG